MNNKIMSSVHSVQKEASIQLLQIIKEKKTKCSNKSQLSSSSRSYSFFNHYC